MTKVIDSVSGATNYIVIPTACSYGTITAISRSGTTVTVTVRNLSGEPHTMTAGFMVIAVKG